jgi:Spy/CpxP family protein refolding chaperone
MFNIKVRQLIALTASATLFFCQSAFAKTTMDSIGTGSAGSYNHEELKGDSSKSKTMHPHISGSEDHHISGNSLHHRSERSTYKKGYSHKKPEGSQSKSYGKYGHGKKSHAYKGGYGKSHGHKRGSHGGHGKSPFKHVMDYQFKLGLTDIQINKMKELDLEFKKKIIQAKADHEIAHMELDLQVHSGKVDEAKIRTAGAKIVASKTNKIIAMIDAKIQLLNLLTADQRHKMAKMH